MTKMSTNTACMAVEDDDKLKVKMTMKYGKGIHPLTNGKFILICLLAKKNISAPPPPTKTNKQTNSGILVTASVLFVLHV